MVEGIHRLDDNLIENRPPHIKWKDEFKDMKDVEKVPVLTALAESMNQAAYLIQIERNELNVLCEYKEKQLIQLKEAMQQNMDMLTSEVTIMNENRQGFNEEVARLNRLNRKLEKRVKELETK
jgi:hypothetical protein